MRATESPLDPEEVPSPTLLWIVRGITIIGLLVIVVLFVNLSLTVSRNQRSDTQALCALRSDLQTRVNQGDDFLRKHPHGWNGISVATLQSSISGQKRTIAALSPLICSDTPK